MIRMSDTMTEQHHAICPLCESVASKDTEEEAQEVVDSHNDARHPDDEDARVVGPFREDLDEFMDEVKEEYGRETYSDVSSFIVSADPWGVL